MNPKMLIKNSQDDIELTFPKHSTIGFKISGGADSAIVAYMLAKYKTEYDPSVRLIPCTFISAVKPYQEIYSNKVLAKIQELTGVEYADRVVENVRSTEPHYAQDQQYHIDQARQKNKFIFLLNGITRNPPVEVYDTWLPETGPTDDRDEIDGKKEQNPTGLNWQPLININKQGVAELYDTLGVTDSIFPLTRSCEALTTDFSKHCGTCWFCREREWGFGRLV